MTKVKKAIIPAAGFGTRFLPVTKSVPKEMLPIVDKPTIQYIVEEVVASGIEEILIVTSSYKKTIEDYFDYSYELEHHLKLKNKHDDFKKIREISNMANIQYIRQKQPLGLGHAILCAKSFINNEPFAVLLGDDVVLAKNGEKPALLQCIETFNEVNSPILGIQKVLHNSVSKYGIIEPDGEIKKFSTIIPIKSVIEKPKIENAPSDYAILGRYILTPEIFVELSKIKPKKNKEIELTEAIFKLSKYQKIYGKIFTGHRYDIGSKIGFIHATLDVALEYNDIKNDVKKLILEYAKKIKK